MKKRIPEKNKKGGENMFTLSLKLAQFVQNRSRIIGVVCLVVMLLVVATTIWAQGTGLEEALGKPIDRIIKLLAGPIGRGVAIACLGGCLYSALRERYLTSFLCGIAALSLMFIKQIIEGLFIE